MMSRVSDRPVVGARDRSGIRLCPIRRRALTLLSALLPLLVCGVAHGQEGSWEPGFGVPGLDGPVYTLAVYQGQLYAGGSFAEWAGGTVPGVARWDASAWQRLGPGLRGFRYVPGQTPPRITVRALLEHQGELIVAGAFSGVGEEDSPCIAAWNGQEWRTLASLPADSNVGGSGSRVNALAVYRGELIAAGSFGGSNALKGNVARWDGHAWRPLGPDVRSEVGCLAVHDDALYAGGERLERWDGTSWQRVDPPGWGPTYALCSYEGKLYAGGQYGLNQGGYTAIEMWDGQAWSSMGGFSPETPFRLVNTLTVVRGQLFAGLGPWELAGDQGPTLLRWDGDAWQPVGREEDSGAAISGSIQAVVPWGDGLAVGGRFWQAGSASTTNIAAWDGRTWAPVGRGRSPLADLRAATVWNGETVAAIGSDRDTVNRIVRFDGEAWRPIAPALQINSLQPDRGVAALGVYHGSLIAAGGIYQSGSAGLPGIARFDGERWQSLGSNLTGPVYAIAVYKDRLIAAGAFHLDDDLVPPGIAAWDGASWSPLGSGLSRRSTWPVVRALCVLGDDLYAAGEFTEAGGVPALNIARWDGTAWSAVGTGLGDDTYRTVIRALVAYQGDLIAGGYLSRAGDVEVEGSARWDGADWHPMPSATEATGPFSFVAALCLYNGDLIAGGGGGGGIARWDGSVWQSLGGGVYQDTWGWSCDPGPCPPSLPGYVRVLASCRDYLLVGGDFTDAGAYPAGSVGMWRDTEFPPTVCLFSAERSGDGVDVRWEVVGRSERTSFVLCRRIRGGGRIPVSLEQFEGQTLYQVIDQAGPSGEVEYWLEMRSPGREPEWIGPALLPPRSPEPGILSLRPVGPNPSAGVLMLNYELSWPGPVRLSLFDLMGRWLATPIEGSESAGGHSFLFRFEDAGGRPLPSGTYLLSWEGLGRRQVTKVTVRR